MINHVLVVNHILILQMNLLIKKKNRECSIMDSNKIKKGLGRGLSSLIGETKVRFKY